MRYWRETERAGIYEVPERKMPRIPDVHLQSIVYIYPSDQAAAEGQQVGGTGFVVNYAAQGTNWRIRYVVTNQHVVDGGGHWVRLNDPAGTHIVHVAPENWEPAPNGDDFAVSLLPLPGHVRPYELSLESLGLTQEEAVELGVGPGDEAYMVGRLLAHGGRATNNPVARFGSIALMPNPMEPVLDGRGRDVEAYLIEMRSHAGFSGSPVFLLIPHMTYRGGLFDDTSKEDNITRFRLIGIDTGHKIDYLPIYERAVDHTWAKRDGLLTEHFTDVAIVAPIWSLIDLLDRPDMANQRLRLAEELEARRGQERAISDQSSTLDLNGGSRYTRSTDSSPMWRLRTSRLSPY